MHSLVTVIALLLVACGRIGFDDGGFQPYTRATVVMPMVHDQGDSFGIRTALSADGNTLAVSAQGESSGISGDPLDNSQYAAGAAYVFHRAGATWVQDAYLKSPAPAGFQALGNSLALSGDGSTVAVGAQAEGGTGAVHLFERASGWSKRTTVLASDGQPGDMFGDVSLSRTGSVLVVGAYGRTGATGAAYVFRRSGATWIEEAILQAKLPAPSAYTGDYVVISGDGNTIMLAGGRDDRVAADAGAVDMFEYRDGSWVLESSITASNAQAGDLFGLTVAMSDDARVLAIGADGVSGFSGAVYMVVRDGSGWREEAIVTAPKADPGDEFSWALALSGDGNVLGVGARSERSAASGFDGDASDNSLNNAGAAYVFDRASGWEPREYIKDPVSMEGANWGGAVALSGDGRLMLVGAYSADNGAGRAFVFE